MVNDECEEGEIIEINEYEDISSDEEFSLKQRIAELEARNFELEKIASISSSKICDYGKCENFRPYAGFASSSTK